jgi:hypothetical protein
VRLSGGADDVVGKARGHASSLFSWRKAARAVSIFD